jgi:hypothetical protein
MQSCQDTTIDAFNEYVNGLRVSQDVDARLTLTTFDSESLDVVHENTHVSDFPELSRRDYQPRAMTPLFDAVWHAVRRADLQPKREGETVSLVILTDGMENASREFCAADVRKLLDERRQQGWLILFIGADLDNFKDAESMGQAASRNLSSAKGAMRNAMKASAALQARYAKGDRGGYTPEERAAAQDPDAKL